MGHDAWRLLTTILQVRMWETFFFTQQILVVTKEEQENNRYYKKKTCQVPQVQKRELCD